jgi:hypothetical protein
MSSALRIESSRANGAKSRGPVTPAGKAASAANASRSTGPATPEGKAISSRNALRHGIRAESIALETESADDFAAHLAHLQDELQPEPGIELKLVQTMAVASWRQMRLWNLEKTQLDSQVSKEEARFDRDDATPSVRLARAYRFLCDSTTTLEKLNRYEAHSDRQYHRALALLMDYRDRKSKKNSVFTERTEPNPG